MLDSPYLWLILAAFVAATASLRGFIENYTADVVFKKRQPEASIVVRVISFALVLIGFLIFAPPIALPFGVIGGLLLSGIIDSLGTVPYLRAFKNEEATGMAVLGQLNPIFALILGYFFLGDQFSLTKILAFLLILGAALLVIRSRGKRFQKLKLRATILVALSALGWVGASVIFVALNRAHSIPFATAFFWFAAGKWLADLVLSLIFRSWRRRSLAAFRAAKRQFLLSLSSSEILRAADNFFWMFALTIAPAVGIASVTERTLRLFTTFAFGLALSLIWPKFGRETMTRRVILMHLIAVVLAAVGVFLIQL